MTQELQTEMPKLLTQKQAAEFLSISHRTLENYRLTGEGPKWVRLGRRLIRYRMEDILAFAGMQSMPEIGNE